MADQYVLDTHALVWFLEGNPRLGVRARAVMEDRANRLILPIIALAEAAWIVEKGRCGIASVKDLFGQVRAAPHVTVKEIRLRILERSTSLTALTELHDRLIVATALVMQRAGDATYLVTKDANIVASGLVPVIW